MEGSAKVDAPSFMAALLVLCGLLFYIPFGSRGLSFCTLLYMKSNCVALSILPKSHPLLELQNDSITPFFSGLTFDEYGCKGTGFFRHGKIILCISKKHVILHAKRGYTLVNVLKLLLIIKLFYYE